MQQLQFIVIKIYFTINKWTLELTVS